MEEEEPRTITSQCSLILDLPPSCIEFSPTSPDLFVVGTYYLDTAPMAAATPTPQHDDESLQLSDSELQPSQQRTGSVILLQLLDAQVIPLQTLATSSAVLDVHFSPHHQNIIATATSTGALSFYELALTHPPIHLAHLNSTQYFNKDTLVLALAFHPKSSDLIGVSLSSGEIALCQIQTPEKEESVIWKLPAHSLEAWTIIFTEASFDERAAEFFYSGGDDSVFCTHAIRSSGSIRDIQQIETKRNKRAHGAGVTAIVALPLSPILITGSYDDRVRVFDPESSNVLAEANIGGGIWRLKVLSSHDKPQSEEADASFLILASCMHSGARILKISRRSKAWSIKVLAKFTEHGSMNYGSDAQPAQRALGRDHGLVTCVSTSFYDRLLCVWRYDEAEEEAPGVQALRTQDK